MDASALFAYARIEDCRICGQPTHVALTHALDKVSGVVEPTCQRCTFWFFRMVKQFQELLASELGTRFAEAASSYLIENMRQRALRGGV